MDEEGSKLAAACRHARASNRHRLQKLGTLRRKLSIGVNVSMSRIPCRLSCAASLEMVLIALGRRLGRLIIFGFEANCPLLAGEEGGKDWRNVLGRNTLRQLTIVLGAWWRSRCETPCVTLVAPSRNEAEREGRWQFGRHFWIRTKRRGACSWRAVAETI